MENKFSSKIKMSWVIIGISYALYFLIDWFVFHREMVALMLVITLVTFKMGLPFADKVVNSLYNSILGGVTLFGPLQMFLGIFVIKLLVRIIVASLAGQFIAPYTIGKAIADRLAVE